MTENIIAYYRLSPRWRIIARGGREVRLGRQEFLIISTLLAALPRPLTSQELIEVIWGDRVDGGPIWARGEIRARISQLRTGHKHHKVITPPQLDQLGLKITNVRKKLYQIEILPLEEP